MRNTKQKDLILNVVQTSSDHPTAETVYERARAVMPSISLGTVYRNLKQLEESGKVRLVRSDQDTMRYDKTVFPHAHLKCVVCGSVVDVMEVECEKIIKTVSEATDYEVLGIEVAIDGICPECKSRKRNNK